MSCSLGKSHERAFETCIHRASFPLVLLHSDVWTSHVLSISGYKYLVLFVYDYSHYTWLFPMRYKSEVPIHFHNLHVTTENMCNARIRCLQLDG